MNGARRTVVMALALLVLGPALAADWDFSPVISIGAERSDNVFSVSNSAPDAITDDVSVNVGVTLAWTASSPRDEFSFAYVPVFVRYQDFDTLDNTSHRIALTWDRDVSPRTVWENRLAWARREQQRVLPESPELSQSVVPRTRTDSMAFGTTLRWSAAQRSRIVFAATGATTKYDEGIIEGEDLDGDGTIDIAPVRVDDAVTLTGQLGYEYDLSPISVLGLSLFTSRIDEGFRGETDVHRLLGVFTRGTPERVALTFTAGVAATSVRDPGELAAEEDYEEPTEAVGSIDIATRAFRRGRFNIGASQDVASSAGVSGAAVTREAHMSFTHPTGRWSNIGLHAFYALREPLEEVNLAGETTTTSYRAEWSAAFSPRWQLVFAGERFEQEADDATLDAEYNVWSAGLRWSPTAPRR